MVNKADQIYIARQPILNANQKVQAYELLFRSGLKNAFDPSVDQDYASKKMMSDAIHLWGMDSLIGGHKAFVNLTENVLLSDIPFIFDKDRVVIELLETIRPTKAVMERCRELKKRGFVLALDDYEGDPAYQDLFEYIDVLKVDFIGTNWEERQRIATMAKSYPISLLAEKVESHEEYRRGVDLGYQLFQGYFFSKPEVMAGRDIPPQKLNMLQLMQKIYDSDLEFNQLERLISQDVSLSYKLMRFINSVSFGFKKEVRSIRHALVLLGEREIRKWVSLIALSSMGEDKPHEMLVLSLGRATFLQELALTLGRRDHTEDLFLMGMFSLIDGFLDKTMQEILPDLPLHKRVKAALLGQSSELSSYYDLMKAYEQGQWEHVQCLRDRLGLGPVDLFEIYQKALHESAKVNGLA